MQIFEKIKLFGSTYAVELGVSAIIILVAFSSCDLGRASSGPGSGVITIENDLDAVALPASPSGQVEGASTSNPSPPTGVQSETKSETKGPIVASKNGVRYYYLHCSGVSRLSEKNKIYFASAKEAESFGLTIAANCSAE